MKALDLFCGEGGASMGLHMAGFEVTGVDINPQPKYPFKFVQADVMNLDLGWADFYWASPPCQPFTVLGGREDLSKYPDLIDKTRQLLESTGKPWVMENVPGAPLRADLTLCANYFGLRSYRHRIFECSFPVYQPPHKPHRVRVNRRGENRKKHWANGGHITITGDIGTYVGPEAMGIDWMSGNGLSQAVPPVYAKYIANQWLKLGFRDAHIESLQNKWASRPLSSEDQSARIARLENAIRWACGEIGEFPGEDTGKGRYHWRTELRRRAGVPYCSPLETPEAMHARIVTETADAIASQMEREVAK